MSIGGDIGNEVKTGDTVTNGTHNIVLLAVLILLKFEQLLVSNLY